MLYKTEQKHAHPFIGRNYTGFEWAELVGGRKQDTKRKGGAKFGLCLRLAFYCQTHYLVCLFLMTAEFKP